MENEETKAVKEVAKFGTKTLDTVDKLGGYLARVFGTVPEDIVGVIGGDWLKHIRTRNATRMCQRTEEILRERGVLDKTEPMSPSLALPLLEAAADETREELREMWAHLLASGMDPDRQGDVRKLIISTVKKLDPLDVLFLKELYSLDVEWFPLIDLMTAIGATEDEIIITHRNLDVLGCLYGDETLLSTAIQTLQTARVGLTALGKEIVRLCS